MKQWPILEMKTRNHELFGAVLVIPVWLIAMLWNMKTVSGCIRRYNGFRYGQAVCSLEQTTVTCTYTTEGILTPAIVQKAGPYTKYETAIIEAGIWKISDQAFKNCKELKYISMSETVTYIGLDAFHSIAATSITFPGSVTTLNARAVNSCPKMTELKMSHQNGPFKSHEGLIIWHKNDKTYLHVIPTMIYSGETFRVPDVYGISAQTIRWNQATIIEIPDSVVEMGSSSLYCCIHLHTLRIGSGLRYISSDTFSGLSALTTIELSSENHYLYHRGDENGQIFGKNQEGTDTPLSIIWISVASTAITIPGTVTEIGYFLLQNSPLLTSLSVEQSSSTYATACGGLVLCSKDLTYAYCAAGSLESLVVSSTVTAIGSACCRNLRSLKTATFHSQIKSLGSEIFRGCTALESVDFASCITWNSVFGSMMLANCHSLKTILNWPTNTIRLGYRALFKCAFETLALPPQVIEADEQAFAYCSQLKNITFPATFVSLGSLSLAYCSQLENVTFEETSRLAEIGTVAFSNCVSLTSITLPDSVTVLESNCFLSCSSLVSIDVEGNTGLYCSDGFCLYQSMSQNGAVSNPYHSFLLCPPGASKVTLHEKTSVIQMMAFYECNKLTTVEMNDLLERIEKSAFFGCEIIELIRIPGSVNFIGNSAFDSCAKLKNILYCGEMDIQSEGEPFPGDPTIYVSQAFQGSEFCGHSYSAILDLQCNIPTTIFTDSPMPLVGWRMIKPFVVSFHMFQTLVWS